MPKLKYKHEAIKQTIYAAEIIKRALKKKMGKEVKETVLGRGELRQLLSDDQGKGLKPVLTQAIKRFGITVFFDSSVEFQFIILDPEKPIIKVKRIRE